MKLVSNWRTAARWISMWCMGINGAMATVWLALPKHYQDLIPPEWIMRGVIAFVVTGMIGRMFKQPDLSPCPPKDPQP